MTTDSNATPDDVAEEATRETRHELAMQELVAMRSCWDAVEALSDKQRASVLGWLDAQFREAAQP